MTISLNATIAVYKNRLAIGKDNDLLFKLSNNINNFNKITTYTNKKNIIIIGNNTYKSLSVDFPSNSINIILTNDIILLKKTEYVNYSELRYLLPNTPYYMTGDNFADLYFRDINQKNPSTNLNIIVIGGAKVFDFFLNNKHKELMPTALYITHVINPQFNKRGIIPDTFMSNFDDMYSLVTCSTPHALDMQSATSTENKKKEYKIRYLQYSLKNYLKGNYESTNSSTISQEIKYINLMNDILKFGNTRVDRTNTGTLSLFGKILEFDISSTIPMMTTRNIPFKTIIEELLWFCRGDTDNKVLQDQGVIIWNGNSSREFLDSRNLQSYPEGVVGPMYGWQWRHCGAIYKPEFANTSNFSAEERNSWGGIDQLENIVKLLKNDPFSRRIIMINYNPMVLTDVALPSCHTQVQFYVREHNGNKHLSCKFDMRSSDSLAFSYNCVSFSVLTYILAMKCNMIPDKLIYTSGDCHIYINHIDQIKEQIKRTMRPEPGLHINPMIRDKDWSEMTVNDFELLGYFPHPAIKMQMAI